MYRKRNGSLSFSFSRLVLNAVPNFANSWEPGTIDITPQRQDTLYAYQMAKGWPACLSLDERSFYWAGCCDRERQSERMFFALLKNGVLSEREVPSVASGSGVNGEANGVSGAVNGNSNASSSSSATTNNASTTTTIVTVDTRKITSKFIHQLAFISQTSQKNLINVVFFWEEEVQRLKKLDAEESELSDLIRSAERKSGTNPHNLAESVPHPTQPNGQTQSQTEKPQQPQSQNPESTQPSDPTLPEAPSEPTPDQRAELDRLRFARERVRMKKRQVPTQRDPDIERDTDNVLARAFSVSVGMDGGVTRGMDHVLGGYYGGDGSGQRAEERGQSTGFGSIGGGLREQPRSNMGAGATRTTTAPSEMPPAYRASISC